MSQFHALFAWVVVAANGLVGVWAVASIRFPGLRHRTLWYSIAAAQVAILIEVFIGIYLRAIDGRVIASFHVFYGVMGIVFVALGYIYALGSSWVQERRELFWGVLSLFLMGIAIRAIVQANAV